MASLDCERRDARVPRKLRIAEEDAATKPPEVNPTVIRHAFTVISSRFPSEVSLQDLHAFVGAHRLGISPATLRDMVGKARAKRQDWRAQRRDLPVRVARDSLWVEDVVWALRVRKTRREFDKWEVSEHRDEWIAILEAATPDNPTVFAAPADHRIAPPLSYTELLEEFAHNAVSAPSSGGFSSYAGSSSERQFSKGEGGGGTSTESRSDSAGKTWVPLEARAPSSLLMTSRPGSATAGMAVGATTAGSNDWEGEGGVGESTLLWFPNGGSSGAGSRGGGRRGAQAMPGQERGLFGRKPTPKMAARSACYAPRQRPPCSIDGRRPIPEIVSADTVELYEMEEDINNSGFTFVEPAAADLSVTATPLCEPRHDLGAKWGSATSAVTFDENTNPYHTNAAKSGIEVSNEDNENDLAALPPKIQKLSCSTTENRGAPASATDALITVAPTHGGSTYSRPPMSPPPCDRKHASLPITASSSATPSGRIDGVPSESRGTPGINEASIAPAGGMAAETCCRGVWNDDGGSEAEWWREAMAPSLRPETKGPLFDVAAESDASVWRGEDGVDGDLCGHRRPATAPTCGFSTGLKHRDLEGRLRHRSSISELEGLAWTRVQAKEVALTRARSGSRFRHTIGRNSIRKNFDRSLKEKACETLALDLRGYGNPLIAPETTSPRREKIPSACPGSPTTRRNAWMLGKEGTNGHALLRNKPPPFRATRGRTLQQDRVTVAVDQADMWGKCAQANFGRFGEKPYVHCFRPHTSDGLYGFTFGTPQIPRSAPDKPGASR